MKQPEALKLAEWLDTAATIADMGHKPEKNDQRRLASAELRRLHEVNQELLESLKCVLHDCDFLDMVPSNEPGRDKGPWLIATEAIAKAGGAA